MDTTRNDLRRFTLATALAAVPLLLIVLGYVVADPFRVLRPTDPFWRADDTMHVGTNKSMISTFQFDSRHKLYRWDSYIFGSSLSIAYRADDWAVFLPDTARVFHFDGAWETLRGIQLKMHYVVDQGEHIANALIVMDVEIFRRDDIHHPAPYLFRQPPQITPEHDLLQFHWSFFRQWLNREFLLAYIDLKLNGLQPYMLQHSIFTTEQPDYDPVVNEESYPFYENAIAADIDAFYARRAQLFEGLPTEEHTAPPQLTADNPIAANNRRIIADMARLLRDEHTDFRIVLVPRLSLERINPADLRLLQDTFGADRITDLSGKNDLSTEPHNFYDGYSHPRPTTCSQVLDSIYAR